MANEESSETVELLIRCALQSFEDTSLRCPLDWTVQRLKQELSSVCSSKPEASRQRLIYAGHCLQDSNTLRSIFETRPTEDTRVLHLVCPPKDLPEFGLRKRRTQKSSTKNLPGSATSAASAADAQPPVVNHEATPQTAQFNPWANYSTFLPYTISNATPADAQMQSIYNAYMYSYYSYMQQLMRGYNGGIPTPVAVPQLYQPYQYYGAPQMPYLPQQQQQMQPPQPAAGAEVQNAAAGGLAQNAIIGDVDAPQRDFLDIVYKAIRLCFLVMLVYVYSSAERFLGVLFFILLAWFIQARRDRNGRERAGREVAQAVNNVRQQQQAEGAETDDSGVSDEDETARRNHPAEEYHEPSAWTVFWSTCYAFISGFFASLFPENPAPVNVN